MDENDINNDDCNDNKLKKLMRCQMEILGLEKEKNCPVKKKQKKENNSFGHLGHLIEDEDRSFFESLLPTVRPFDNDMKLLFCSRILNLLMELKN